mmetsp:Transcript_1167/g.4933  ORF Transcript_1167/g.4933 Transcript_1167/m.4933 type:complete len:253 (+) Transcript_1167:2507-3265(+)
MQLLIDEDLDVLLYFVTGEPYPFHVVLRSLCRCRKALGSLLIQTKRADEDRVPKVLALINALEVPFKRSPGLRSRMCSSKGFEHEIWLVRGAYVSVRTPICGVLGIIRGSFGKPERQLVRVCNVQHRRTQGFKIKWITIGHPDAVRRLRNPVLHKQREKQQTDDGSETNAQTFYLQGAQKARATCSMLDKGELILWLSAPSCATISTGAFSRHAQALAEVRAATSAQAEPGCDEVDPRIAGGQASEPGSAAA